MNEQPGINPATGATAQAAVARVFASLALIAALAPVVVLAVADRTAGLAATAAAAMLVAAIAGGYVLVSRRLGTALAAAEAEAGVRSDMPWIHQRLHSAMQGISDGFILWDENDRMLIHKGHAGLNAEPLVYVGKTFREHVAELYEVVDPTSSGGDLEAWIEKRTAWFRDADGAHEILLRTGRTVLLTERRAADGSTVATFTDITEQKEAGRQLQISERRLAHAQKLASVGIWEYDMRSGEMYWSDVLYRILGVPPGTPPLSLDEYLTLVHPANRDLVRSTFNRLLTTGGQYNQEYQVIRPDGEFRTVRTEAESIRDESGGVARVLGAVHDISDIKGAERNLRRAKELSDQANRAKSEFLANVGHELRTPLNAIIGFSEVLLQEVFGPVGNERYREYAADIRQSGTHLLGVINDLLDYSKLEAGHLELHLERVAVAGTIEKTKRLLHERAESQSVALVAEPGSPDIEVDADERKLTQILLNLVSNAIKFTPAGGRMTIGAAQTEESIEITVSDTGIGMSEAEITLALSPFGQVDSTLNRQHAGTGLGLPLSRSLAELHGGTLSVESAPGAGTTVRVRLPRPAANEDRPPEKAVLQLVSEARAG